MIYIHVQYKNASLTFDNRSRDVLNTVIVMLNNIMRRHNFSYNNSLLQLQNIDGFFFFHYFQRDFVTFG